MNADQSWRQLIFRGGIFLTVLDALAFVCLILFPALFVANYLSVGFVAAIVCIICGFFGVGRSRKILLLAATAEVGLWFFMSIGL